MKWTESILLFFYDFFQLSQHYFYLLASCFSFNFFSSSNFLLFIFYFFLFLLSNFFCFSSSIFFFFYIVSFGFTGDTKFWLLSVFSFLSDLSSLSLIELGGSICFEVCELDSLIYYLNFFNHYHFSYKKQQLMA